MAYSAGALIGLNEAVTAIMWQQSQIIVGNPNSYSGFPLYFPVPQGEDSAGTYVPGVTYVARLGDVTVWEVTSILLSEASVTPNGVATPGAQVDVGASTTTVLWTPTAGLEFTSNGFNAVWLNPFNLYIMTYRFTTYDISQGRYDYVVAAVAAPVVSPARDFGTICCLVASELEPEPALYAPWVGGFNDTQTLANRIQYQSEKGRKIVS